MAAESRASASKAGAARREIDADGMLVTPGFVDIHTHYDGQVTWDPYLTPSCWHGVTTLVMGNCGVGFAPVQPDKHEFLIGLMEGVEDIPGTALAEGIKWGWESFPEYLDAVAAMPRVLDVGAQVPHGAVRAYVMGERGAHNEEATDDDIRRMADVVREGLRAGALGFTTSRTMLHRAKNKEVVPGTYASEDELIGIGRVLGEVGHGVFEMASDMAGPDADHGVDDQAVLGDAAADHVCDGTGRFQSRGMARDARSRARLQLRWRSSRSTNLAPPHRNADGARKLAASVHHPSDLSSRARASAARRARRTDAQS